MKILIRDLIFFCFIIYFNEVHEKGVKCKLCHRLGGGVCPKVVEQGLRCIYNNQGFWYLDHLDVQWEGVYDAEPLEGITF